MRRTAMLVLAVGGVALGHTATYSVVPHHGDAHGVAHAYPQEFAAAALLSLCALLAWLSVQEFRGRNHTVPVRALVGAQLLGFAALEISERALAADLASLLDQPAVWIGLLVQAAVAATLRCGFHVLPRLLASVLARPRRTVRLPRTDLPVATAGTATWNNVHRRGRVAPRAPPLTAGA